VGKVPGKLFFNGKNMKNAAWSVCTSLYKNGEITDARALSLKIQYTA